MLRHSAHHHGSFAVSATSGATVHPAAPLCPAVKSCAAALWKWILKVLWRHGETWPVRTRLKNNCSAAQGIRAAYQPKLVVCPRTSLEL
jgi:hypothetical protein